MKKTAGQVYKMSGKFKVRLLETPSEKQVFAKVECLEFYGDYKKGETYELNVDFMY